MRLLVCLVAVCSAFVTFRAEAQMVHTYSIVARDSATGDLGVAVQSHWFSVGSIVTWAEAGVGAVATQSLVDPAYGPLGLELMKRGKTAGQTLDALLASDPGRDVRQVAMVDVSGNIAVHTGPKCIREAGHISGNGYSVQANLMLNDQVWPAMARAYENASGDLADRMMSALDAAQSAILIVKGTSTGREWADRVMELRVEDHPDPLAELRRLILVHRAYDFMNRGDLAIEHGDMDGALREYGSAQELFPDNLEMKFWTAISLANAGKVEESLPMFRQIFALDINWATLVPRLPASGILPDDKELIRRILSAVPRQERPRGEQ